MNKRTPSSQISALGWNQLPGGAINVAASPDGSIWVVSNSYFAPIGNPIFRYASGTWTNIPGVATRLSVAPDGTLWAINGLGNIYSYKSGVWTAIAGGASDVSAAPDGSIYVVSSIYGNAYGNAIYHYSSGTWTQMPGAGVRIAASWDTGSYPGGITPGGYYLANALGAIYYYAPSTGYSQLPGGAAQLAPTVSGGLFALGLPNYPGLGYPIYYNDVSTGAWTQQPGAAVSIATSGNSAYVVGGGGGIYSSTFAPITHSGGGAPLSGPILAPGNTWGPVAEANALNFPVQSGFNGSGYTIAVVMSGNISATDLQQYLTYFQIPTTNRTFGYKLIDGASAVPNNNGTSESALDVETIAGLAPGANIVLYVIPDLSTQSINDAYNQILSDKQASIVSSSLSGCEAGFSVSGMTAIIQAGSSAGVTFVASSGDQGNACYSGVSAQSPYVQGVGYPASDPNVIGVGGTETNPPQVLSSAITWNDSYTADGSQEASGGGVSTVFSLPAFQQGLAGTASKTYRNVPDVSMPANNAAVVLSGAWVGFNGTSWGAPAFAAMLSEVYQYCGTAFSGAAAIPYRVNSRAPSTAFIDVLTGNNQYTLPSGPASPAYAAGAGYDNATGIGVPLGLPFAQALCPNGVPAFGTDLQGGRAAVQALRAAQAYRMNVTPSASRFINLGRKQQTESVRIQIVLDSRSSALANQERTVIQTLERAGFSIVKTFTNHLVIDATAPSRKVEKLFNTEMDNVAQGRFAKAYLPATAITVPASLAPYVRGISLDNVINMTTRKR